MSFYRDQLEDYLSGLHVKAERVLDVGGAAKPVKSRVASWDVKHYHILDNGLEERDQSHITDFSFDINYPIDPKIVASDVSPYKEPHNLAFCLEVMEYVFDPVTAIRNLSLFLTIGGRLIISFPFVYPVHKPIEADFLRYTPQGATKLLAEAGFKTEAIHSRIDRSGKLLEFYKADGMHVGGNAHVTGVIIEARKQ